MTGKELARWREERMHWTQPQAARWWGCSQRTWQRYEESTEVPVAVSRRVLNPFHDVTYLVDQTETP